MPDSPDTGFRPDLVTLADDAYQQVLKIQFDRGAFGSKTWEEVIAEQPECMPLRRCAMPDFATGRACKWPMLTVTYSPRLTLPGLTVEQILAAYQQACNEWNKVCGIRLTFSQDHGRANIYANSGKIDGRSGTLAWSYLPCNANQYSRMEQLYDNAEGWTYDWLVEVACHEIGHAIGISHGPKGALMYAYSGGGRVMAPQAWDIEEAVARYGVPEEPPVPAPPGGLDVSGVLIINGKVFNLNPVPA